MGLKGFIADLEIKECNGESPKIFNILKNMEFEPDVYWYAGSGNDISPLLFDVPNNPTGRRLLTMEANAKEKPILLWMNDYANYLADFPNDNQMNSVANTEYEDLWSLYGASCSFGAHKEIYSLGDLEFSLFSVNVKNRGQGWHSRPPEGDDYIVLFSNLKSEHLIPKVFARYRIHINTVAMIKQGGFSGQTFGHYRNLPTRLKRHEKKIGLVDFWIIDSQGVNNEVVPISNGLKEYEYLGGPVPWGWSPTRLYGRKGVKYERNKKPDIREQ